VIFRRAFAEKVMAGEKTLTRPLCSGNPRSPWRRERCRHPPVGSFAVGARARPADRPYLERLLNGVLVNAFYTWTARDPEVNAYECRLAAQLVRGRWCTPLQVLRRHKQKGLPHPDARYAKHRQDIAILDQHLASQAAAHARTAEPQRQEGRQPEPAEEDRQR